MSKRHQSSRRKTYGRRQHEVRERHDRVRDSGAFEFDHGDWGSAAQSELLALLDQRAPRVRFALGD
jgi:hypothetical protein